MSFRTASTLKDIIYCLQFDLVVVNQELMAASSLGGWLQLFSIMCKRAQWVCCDCTRWGSRSARSAANAQSDFHWATELEMWLTHRPAEVTVAMQNTLTQCAQTDPFVYLQLFLASKC